MQRETQEMKSHEFRASFSRNKEQLQKVNLFKNSLEKILKKRQESIFQSNFLSLYNHLELHPNLDKNKQNSKTNKEMSRKVCSSIQLKFILFHPKVFE